MEIFRKVAGIPYEVSNLGGVRHSDTKRERDFTDSLQYDQGYKYLHLSTGSHKVSRLVGFAFVDGWFEGAVIDHKDENRSNDHWENLRWVTRAFNSSIAGRKPINQLTKEGKLVKTWDSKAEAGRILGICQSAIGSCISGKSKTSGGFMWEYTDE